MKTKLMKTYILCVFLFYSGLSLASEWELTPQEYCQNFAMAYAKQKDTTLIENSLILKTENLKDKIEKWASNFFQPSGSKFIAGYKCYFKTSKGEGIPEETIMTYLFVVETHQFATHTTTKDWQLIPIKYIKDPVNQTEGYGVFKFLNIK